MELTKDPRLTMLLNESVSLLALDEELCRERRRLVQERQQLLVYQKAVVEQARILRDSLLQYQ